MDNSPSNIGIWTIQNYFDSPINSGIQVTFAMFATALLCSTIYLALRVYKKRKYKVPIKNNRKYEENPA